MSEPRDAIGWGVFAEFEDCILVVPVNREHHPGNGHVLSKDCWCEPTPTGGQSPGERPVWAHNDAEVLGARPSGRTT